MIKSDFIYTKKATRTAADYDLSPDELAVVDLVSAGWTREEAFTLIYRVGQTWTKESLKQTVGDIMNKQGAKKRRKYIRDMQVDEEPTATTTKEPEVIDTLDAVSKENMLRDLIKARSTMAIGTKDWLDVNKLIADLTRMKQDEVKTEDTTVHFYLPIQCHQCELYLKNKKDK